MSQLEMILRGVGLVELALLAAILLKTRRQDQAARIGAALSASLAAFMLSSMPGAARVLGLLIFPLTALCATHPVWFWLFCDALFTDGFRLKRRHKICIAAMALAGVAYQLLLPPVSNDASPVLVRGLGSVFGLASLTFIGLGALAIRAGGRSDLDEPMPSIDDLSRLERSVFERLNSRLVPERLYTREGLTISGLAELLGTQEHVLRHVINRGLGFRNFNDFLHTHRLREAGARLRDPTARRIPVLTIALEVGYGSIGPFNRAFRERFGVTPTEYRRAALDETAGSTTGEALPHAVPR